MSSVYPHTLFQSPRPGQTLGLLCQQEKKGECELGGGGVSTSSGEGVPAVRWPHSLVASQPGLPSRVLRIGMPPLPSSGQGSTFCSEGNTACMCPGLPHPSSSLPCQATTSETGKSQVSHPSACLNIRLSKCKPQAGKSLRNSPLHSHCPHAA